MAAINPACCTDCGLRHSIELELSKQSKAGATRAEEVVDVRDHGEGRDCSGDKQVRYVRPHQRAKESLDAREQSVVPFFVVCLVASEGASVLGVRWPEAGGRLLLASRGRRGRR